MNWFNIYFIDDCGRLFLYSLINHLYGLFVRVLLNRMEYNREKLLQFIRLNLSDKKVKNLNYK